MVKSNQKIKQFAFGTSTGFCLAMFLPTNFVMSKNSEQVMNQATLDLPLPLPSPIVIGVALLIVSLHLILALLLTVLNFMKMGQGQPPLETLRMAMIVSVLGVLIALVSFQLNSPLLNSIALLVIIINSTTFVANFLGAFVVNE